MLRRIAPQSMVARARMKVRRCAASVAFSAATASAASAASAQLGSVPVPCLDDSGWITRLLNASALLRLAEKVLNMSDLSVRMEG
ncbi:hypothetical protein [Rhizobacter sp. P5_C2]